MVTNIVAIIQARMGSTRFPRKMLEPLRDQPLLAWAVKRVSAANYVNKVVVATSSNEQDDGLAQWCHDHQVTIFRGSETDVLDRYYQCGQAYTASHVVRLTGDCPLIDPQIIDMVIELSLTDGNVDYASNVEPMTYPEGMSVEVMPFAALETAWRESELPSHREHVTPFIRFHADRFMHAVLQADPPLTDIRLTIDYPNDLAALEKLLQTLAASGPEDIFSLDDVIKSLQENPNIATQLNARQRDLWRQEVARDEGRSVD